MVLTPTAIQDLGFRLISLVALTWITYFDACKGGWLIDDVDGIANYDGKPQWKLKKENANYWPFGFHTLLRVLRYHIGKMQNPNANWKRDKQPPYISNSRAHHRINLYVASGSFILLYLFLSKLFDKNISFLAVILFIVHPLGTQTLAWMSGIGYVLSFFFMLSGFNIALLTKSWLLSYPGLAASLALVGTFQFLAIQAQFAQMAAAAIYAWLGLWPHAALSALLALTVCRPILQDAVVIRVKIFRDQQMGASTRFHLRKFIVAAKSLFYYTRMALFPKRLGLYHTYGYHYELPYIEAEDKYFYAGVLTLAAWLSAFFLGPPIVQLAAIWYVGFLFLFLNWITIHQFVSERYNWIPALGICLIVSWLLYSNHLLWIWCILFGIAAMRTWCHLPTYYNEIQFYQSNIWNFPTSEVAIGNWGVAYTKIGLMGAAHDMWLVGTRMNPEYDVNWYNVASVLRGQNRIDLAHQALAKALSCRTCHFPKDWVDEMKVLSSDVARMTRPPLGFSRPFQLGRAA